MTKLRWIWIGAVVMGIATNAGAQNYFPENYETSKARFLRQAKELQRNNPRVEIDSISVGAESLTVDLLYLPAQSEARNLIILTSGNHGPEGYAGSALQAIFVEKVLPTLDPSRTGVLLVHALNPWGFKHHRRGTENNVNLNRNFGVSRELFRTRNEEYDRLRRWLEPDGTVCRASKKPANRLLLEMFLKKDVTQESLTEAIGRGQYTSATGLNYGGQDFEIQTTEMISRLRKIAAPYPAIFHIDLHTGLGEKNTLHIMTKNGANPASKRSMSALLGRREDVGQYVVTPPEAEGFYEILGDYASILGELLPEDNRVIVGVTAEFGTVGNGLGGKVRTINRLVLENQGHFHGYADAATGDRVQARFLELFYPSDPVWRTQVLTKGRYFLDTVVKRFIRQHP